MTTTNTESETSRLSTADFAAAAAPRDETQPGEERPIDGRMSPDNQAIEGRTSSETQSAEGRMSPDHQPMERQAQDRADQTPLFKGDDGETFHRRWSDIQASFVDEPRGAVEQADGLVAEVMQRLAQVFAEERRTLEQQWDRSGEADTEELRLALRRYRSFFDRLLAM